MTTPDEKSKGSPVDRFRNILSGEQKKEQSPEVRTYPKRTISPGLNLPKAIARWESFCKKPSAGSIFITSTGLMKDCVNSHLINMPKIMACRRPLIYPYFNVQFSGYLTQYTTDLTVHLNDWRPLMGNILPSQKDFLSFHVHWTSPFRKDCHGINRTYVAAFTCRGRLGCAASFLYTQ